MNTIQQPLVSIIVPCYNHGVFLKECLDSVLAQTYSQWECIVVDNASTDNTKEITNQYIRKDKRITYLYYSTKGVSAARNAGIKNSNGVYILPLDADDKIAATYIQKAVSVLEKNSSTKIIYCEAKLFGNSFRKWNLPKYSLKEMLFENMIFCSALYKRSDYDKTKGYNEEMINGFEDWDFWFRILKNGGEVYQIPEILFFYRIRKTSRNHSLDDEEQKLLFKQIYYNHKEIYDANFKMDELVSEYYLIKKERNSLINSYEYKIGKQILVPLRFIINLFKK